MPQHFYGTDQSSVYLSFQKRACQARGDVDHCRGSKSAWIGPESVFQGLGIQEREQSQLHLWAFSLGPGKNPSI
jgi:hypothetical protein